MLADPINETTSKNRQVDVFLLVFVSADNKNVTARLTTDLHCATKFGSCLVLGVLTVGLYSLVIKTTETAFFSAVKIRLGSGEFFSSEK